MNKEKFLTLFIEQIIKYILDITCILAAQTSTTTSLIYAAIRKGMKILTPINEKNTCTGDSKLINNTFNSIFTSPTHKFMLDPTNEKTKNCKEIKKKLKKRPDMNREKFLTLFVE